MNIEILVLSTSSKNYTTLNSTTNIVVRFLICNYFYNKITIYIVDDCFFVSQGVRQEMDCAMNSADIEGFT